MPSSPASTRAGAPSRHATTLNPVGSVGDGDPIVNLGLTTLDGTAGVPSGSLTIVDDDNRVNGPDGLFGNYLQIDPAGDGDEGVGAPHISTRSSIGDLMIAGNQEYSMMAWVRFADQTGDNMIFGGTEGDVDPVRRSSDPLLARSDQALELEPGRR